VSDVGTREIERKERDGGGIVSAKTGQSVFPFAAILHREIPFTTSIAIDLDSYHEHQYNAQRPGNPTTPPIAHVQYLASDRQCLLRLTDGALAITFTWCVDGGKGVL